MNKTFLTFVVILCSIGASAQYFIPHFGVTINHNNETLNFANARHGTGFMAGAGFNTKLGERMSFQPEIYYMQRNFSFNFTGNDVTSTAVYADKYKIGYLEIPVLLKYTFLSDKLFIVLGPYASIGLGGSDKYNYSTTTISTGQVRHVSGSDNIHYGTPPNGNQVNSTFDHRNDVGIQSGIGVLIMKKIQLECRWDFGAKDLYKSRNSRNNTLLFMVSYPLNLYPEDE